MGDKVYIDVFEKNVPKENCQVIFEERKVSVKLNVNGQEKALTIENLFDDYVKEESNYSVGRVKIEIVLKKTNGNQWKNLTQNKVDHHPNTQMNLYSRDWQAMDKDLDKELEGVGASPEHGLQSIYAQLNDEQKRAFNKSYFESGGTVINGNWDEVKDKSMKPKAPPEGVEVKKWE